MTKSHFRWLLIASLIFGLVAGFFDLLFPSAVPKVFADAQAEFDSSTQNWKIVVLALAALIGTVGYVAVYIGLFTFRAWSQKLAAVLTVFGASLWPFVGASVSSGWAVSLSEISATLWGIVLGVVFFSPIKDHFRAKR